MYRFLQIILGLLFFLSGFGKGLDPLATANKINEYLNIFSLGFLKPLDLFFALCVITIELVVSVLLILNIFPRLSLWISTFMLVVFTPKTLYVALKGSMQFTGCFGHLFNFTPWQAHWKNVFMDVLIIILWVVLSKLSQRQPFSPKIRWWILIISIIVSVVFQTVMIIA